MELILQILLLSVLLLISAFFSGAEVALISMSRHKVREIVKQNHLGATFIQKLKDNPENMLTTILIGNNLANVAASAFTTTIALGVFGSYAVAIVTGVMTFLILVFGEITPKSVALNNSEKFAQLTAPIIWYLSVLLKPINWFLDKFTKTFTGFLGITAKRMEITEDQILSIVHDAEMQGSIKKVEKELIKNVFRFDELEASAIATPKTEMFSLSDETSIYDALANSMKKGFSRVPVYRDNPDNIVGVLHIKDLIKKVLDKNLKDLKQSKKIQVKSTQTIQPMLRKPFFVPETTEISKLLKEFQKRKEHLAIVVDEHGIVHGLVTLEDVVEEIVGEIVDETDKILTNIKKTKSNTWLVRGKVEIEEINNALRTAIPRRRKYNTLNGFLLNKINKIPKSGYAIKHNDFKYTEQKVDEQRILLVKVEKLE